MRRIALTIAFAMGSVFPAGLFADNTKSNGADKAEKQVASNPPDETPSGTKPAEPANPGQNPAKPAEPGNSVKPDTPETTTEPAKSVEPGNSGKPETPAEPSKPADTPSNGKPPEETPSGTKPADPANPGENPATPAEPGNKGKPDAAQDAKDKDAKEAKDKADKGSKDKKDKPGKGGKAGGGRGGGLSLPSMPKSPSPSAIAPAAAALGGAIIGGLFSGGKKEEKKEDDKKEKKNEKKETPVKLAPVAVVASSEAAKAVEPVQPSSQPVAEPLYSAGKGPGIAVISFDGETGAEFAAALAGALIADLKVYSPKKLAEKEYVASAINRLSARKIGAELKVDYLVVGKINKKSETLTIISVFLREVKTGDIKLTENFNLRSAEDRKNAVEAAARKVTEQIGR